ncbi:MAG TPA: Gfo/Idh/MocA family oxidoreductase, partial [Chthoniobacteraceae bacterium]
MLHTPRSRRTFVKQLSLGLAVAPWIRRGAFAQSDKKVRHAAFGTSGQALQDITQIASHPDVEVVAGCDVDERSTKKFREKFPNARIYADYRELLEKEKDLQSANVSTPDHMHAPIGGLCLAHGLAVYGEKPLTHDLYETRRLTELAREKKLVTQMGIQIHSNNEYLTAVKLVQDGVI